MTVRKRNDGKRLVPQGSEVQLEEKIQMAGNIKNSKKNFGKLSGNSDLQPTSDGKLSLRL